jgi:non-ribosomal peptide synthetase component E (peptide arylation enzyme)
MRHPGEQFYPEGVRWDDPIARGTLPDLLSTAAAEYGERPVIEFRDRPISYAELEDKVEIAAAASCARATARINPSRCSSATRRTIPSISSAR